jgi:hypothetical protein
LAFAYLLRAESTVTDHEAGWPFATRAGWHGFRYLIAYGCVCRGSGFQDAATTPLTLGRNINANFNLRAIQ